MTFLKPCPCGKPWQLERFAETDRALVEARVAELGEFVPVHVGSRCFLVARRCIAYHGITGSQLLSGRSGFAEVAAAAIAAVTQLDPGDECTCRTGGCGHRASLHGAGGVCTICQRGACWS